MKLLAALTVVLMLVPVSLAQLYPPAPYSSTPIDLTTLQQAEEDFAKAFAERSPRRFAEFVADDARFTAAGRLTQGKAAIVEQWTRMMQDPALTLTWSPDMVEISRAGDLGFTSGPYELTLKRPDGSVARERGRFASVWRRQADGQYQIIFDIGSPEEQPPAKP